MSLLDGKYEIIAQRPLAEHQTLFEATAPDGSQLSIVWFDLPPEQEGAFEKYRRTLKRLKRSGHAALYDVVSRPGARYVAWERPPEGSGPGRNDELIRLLEADGGHPDDADIRRDGRLYALAFAGVGRPAPEGKPTEHPATPATSGVSWRTLPKPLLAWGASSAMMVLAFALLLVGLHRSANDRLLPVPDLLGRPVAEAIDELYDLGFAVATHEVAAEAAIGTVVELSPAPGSDLRPGRSVDVGYALPPGRFAPTALPQLVGRSHPDETDAALQEAGLALGRVARIAADVPLGVIIAQTPAAGATLEQGATVDILVSDGPLAPATFLPDLVGMREEDARYFAELAGLRPERILIDRIAVAGTSDDTVVSQSLAPNQVLSQSAILRLVVSEASSAPASASDGLPSLIGLSREQAEQRSLTAGLTPSFVERSVERLPEGVVMQTPAPGVAGGGTVTLVLNVHPIAIPVPEVVATVRPPRLREIRYRWIIEAGIPEVTAVVLATTLEGERTLVERRRIRGGEILEGSWRTAAPGPVTFALTLNGAPYGEAQRGQ